MQFNKPTGVTPPGTVTHFLSWTVTEFPIRGVTNVTDQAAKPRSMSHVFAVPFSCKPLKCIYRGESQGDHNHNRKPSAAQSHALLLPWLEPYPLPS